jgi:hypothetical protein
MGLPSTFPMLEIKARFSTTSSSNVKNLNFNVNLLGGASWVNMAVLKPVKIMENLEAL